MAVGNHYRVKLSGNMVGQTILNIFWYRNDGSDGSATDLLQNFRDNIIPTIQTALSTAVTYTNLEVVNMENALDFATAAFSLAGSRAGEVYDAFGAYGFLTFPNSAAYKSGGKRFPGVAEGDVSAGIPTALQLVRLDNIAVDLGRVLGLSPIRYRPNFYSKRCIKDANKKCTSTFIESYGTIATAAWKWVTTQNSRKRGVGI